MERWFIALAIVWVASCPATAGTKVVVDASCGHVVGEQAEIRGRMFGVTAFEGFPAVVWDADYRGKLAALRPGAFRFPGNVSWCCPKRADDLGWYQSDEAVRRLRDCLLFGSTYAYGRFLPVVRRMDAEPMVSLGGVPAWLRTEPVGIPSDFGLWAKHCAAYVGLWKRFDPKLTLVQAWNEPNATWWRDERLKTHPGGHVGAFIEMFNRVSRAIREKHADILLGGPVLCWPPGWPPAQKHKEPWYTWTEWTLPFLKGTKDTAGFFDFHAYDVAPDDLVVQIEMLWNQAALTRGKPLPIWITESGCVLGGRGLDTALDRWNKRILPYERILFALLTQTDKVEGNLVHDLHARAFALLPSIEENPIYWLFWVLRDLRGPRVVARSDDPAVATFATLDRDRLTVVVFNDSDEKKAIDLDVTMPRAGWWIQPSVRMIHLSGRRVAHERSALKLRRTLRKGTGTLALPPRATASVDFCLSYVHRLTRAVREREWFADRTVQPIPSGGEELVLTIDVPKGILDTRTRAHLRLGLLGPEPTDRVRLELNGRELAAKATALQEVPVDGGIVRPGRNRLALSQAAQTKNPRLRLGFASIVTRIRPK